ADLAGAGCGWYAGGMLAPFSERVDTEQAVVDMGRMAIDWWQQATGAVQCHGSLIVAARRDRAELGRFAARTSGVEAMDAEALAECEPDLAGRFAGGLWLAGEAHVDPRIVLPCLLDRLRERGVSVDFGVSEHAHQQQTGTLVDCRGHAACDVLDDL